MNINLNPIDFRISSKLEEFTQNKVKNLEKFYEDIIGVEVYYKVVNTQKLENKSVKVKIDIPGAELFAEKQAKTFEEAVDSATEALRRQIKKHKEKLRGK